MKTKFITITSIAVIAFLFAFSPAMLLSTAYSPKTPVAQAKASLVPPGQIVPSVVQHLPTHIYDSSVDCSTVANCVATVDISYADVFITQGKTLLATVSICGSSLADIYQSSMKAWVISDYSCGELETISASTYSVSTLATGVSGAAGIVWSGKYKMFYVDQFGYGEVAAVTKSGTVTEISLTSSCSGGSYPEFDDVSLSTGTVYTGARYGCAYAIQGTSVVHTTTSIYGAVGTSVNQANGDVYFSDAVYDELYVCKTDLSSCSVVSSFSGGLWGSFYMPHDTSVWTTNYASDTITPVSSSNTVGTAVSTGYENDNGCAAKSGPQLTAPNYYYSDTNFKYNVVKAHGTDVTLGVYYPFSCAYSLSKVP